MLGYFQCQSLQLIWITVGQGPTVLAVGAGGAVCDILSLSTLFSFFFSMDDSWMQTDILSQRAAKSQNNLPTTCNKRSVRGYHHFF